MYTAHNEYIPFGLPSRHLSKRDGNVMSANRTNNSWGVQCFQSTLVTLKDKREHPENDDLCYLRPGSVLAITIHFLNISASGQTLCVNTFN